MPFVINGAPPRVQSQDLGHLAWVLEDVRKSLNNATNAVRRFDWDVKKGANFSARDYADMKMAFRQVYQSAGALEMVGHQHPAKMLRAMGAWIQTVLERPDIFVEEATAVFETACRALSDYFEGLLKGSLASPVALFAQYRAILQLAGTERIHPAQLWPGIASWEDIALGSPLHVPTTNTVWRGQLDEALLPILRDFDAANSRLMADLCLGLASSSSTVVAQTFWSIGAAFFDALCLGELPNEGHVLKKVRKAFGLERAAPIDYESAPFGKFDPAELAQLRKHIGVAAEGWSALAGGDLGRASAVVAQFAEMGTAVLQLHPVSAALVAALTSAVETTTRRANIPSPALAMEVATAILYLEIAYDDLDLANHTMEQRSVRLAARLDRVLAGGEPLPMEHWMESLYRRVGDRKTMGTVVAELAVSLNEIEQALDAYVRSPAEFRLLEPLPVSLGHMRGVFSVLGYDQAALAALRMRSTVEQLLMAKGLDLEKSKKWTLQLVNSLSAMGFLIDMLRYQPAMAKELFEYDESAGEFRLTMEREPGSQHMDRVSKVQAFMPEDVLSREFAWTAEPAVEESPGAIKPDAPIVGMQESTLQQNDGADLEIQEIFLNEASSVVNEGKASIIALSLASSNFDALVSLRRAFHTLKGSARMVGFEDFGEGAWAFEQLLNAWLESKRPASETLLALCEDALDAMVAWIESMSSSQRPAFQAADFRLCADALRLENRYVPHPLSDRIFIEEQYLKVDSSEDEISNQPVVPSPLEHAVEATAGLPPSPLAAAPSIYQGIDVAPAQAVNFIAIGSLNLRLDFFEVFVNEAELWAVKLHSEIENWQTPASHEAVQRAAGLAHALQGSAAAVGFTGLATLAQSMERALEHILLRARPALDDKVLLSDAAQDIRRLVEAFANGVLATPSPAILEALAGLLEASVEASFAPEGSEVQPSEVLAPDAPADEPIQNSASPAIPALQSIAQPATMALTYRQPEGFENQDVLDVDLWPIFFEEGAELLEALAKNVHLSISQPQEVKWRAQTLRVLHTLKGSARLAGALRLGELAHRMESAVERVAENSIAQDVDNAPLLQYLEQLETMFGDLASQIPKEPMEARAGQAEGSMVAQNKEPVRVASPSPAAQLVRTVATTSMRVRAKVLDRLIDQAGEVMTGRTRMANVQLRV